jgi:hypothetical protein
MRCAVCGNEVLEGEVAFRYMRGDGVHRDCAMRIHELHAAHRAEEQRRFEERRRGYTPSVLKRMRREGKHVAKEQAE